MGISYIEMNEQKIPIEDEELRGVVPTMEEDIDKLKYAVGCTDDNLIINTNILSEQTMNNVTCTPNGDDTFTLNGTATAQTFFNINYDGKRAFNRCDYIISGGTSEVSIQVVTSNSLIASSEGEEIEFTISNKADNWVRILINEGTVLDNVTVYPKVTYAFTKSLQEQLNRELGNVEYWVPKGTIHNPERNYYIKTKNTLKVWYQIELTSELNSTNSVFNLCDNICSTFGLKSHLNAWNISYCLNYTALPYRYYTIAFIANNNVMSVSYNGTAVPAGTNVYGYLEFAIDV